jgi:hypothetical protein
VRHHGTTPKLANPGRGLLRAVRMQIGEQEIRASLGERESHGASHPAGGTGDERGPSGEVKHCG